MQFIESELTIYAILLSKIKDKQGFDLKYNTLKNDPHNIIYVLKKFMFDNLKDCFTSFEKFESFQFDGRNPKNHEPISVDLSSYKFLKGFIPKSKCDLPNTKYDVMMFSMKILRLLCPNIIDENWTKMSKNANK